MAVAKWNNEEFIGRLSECILWGADKCTEDMPVNITGTDGREYEIKIAYGYPTVFTPGLPCQVLNWKK